VKTGRVDLGGPPPAGPTASSLLSAVRTGTADAPARPHVSSPVTSEGASARVPKDMAVSVSHTFHFYYLQCRDFSRAMNTDLLARVDGDTKHGQIHILGFLAT